MSDLKPCPMCEKGKGVTTYAGAKRYIYCNQCHAQTAIYETLDEAIIAWNTRPAEDALNYDLKALNVIYNTQAAEWEKELERLKAELENVLMILSMIDWLYSDENEKARMWELKIGGLSPSEWMCDIVRKAREIIGNIHEEQTK